ncbi:MAG: DUF4282 domain-containing protein [Desulfitobacteriia bacterium]|jgi:hypothetical protein
MGKFSSFEKMITPTIITVLFWVGVILSIVTGIVSIISGFAIGEGAMALSGLLILILGPLFSRVYCELLIVIFKIHKTLLDINEKLEKES